MLRLASEYLKFRRGVLGRSVVALSVAGLLLASAAVAKAQQPRPMPQPAPAQGGAAAAPRAGTAPATVATPGAAKAAPPAPAAPPAQPGAPAKKSKLPAPVELRGNDLLTKDGVQLAATYYASAKGKDAVPLILLHMWKGSRKDYATLAPMLQEAGHAVLVPDLRGHGDATQVITVGGVRELDANRLSTEQFARMVRFDMETLKSFLVKEHNAERLNLEKLTLVGAELGASVALDWARMDWSWPPLSGKKQGQDVKALVLLSPQHAFRGFSIQNALAHPAIRTQLSILIIAGTRDARVSADANRIHTMLERYRSEPTDPAQRSLFLGLPDTELQGTKMLDVKGLQLEGYIAQFLTLRASDLPISWQKRP